MKREMFPSDTSSALYTKIKNHLKESRTILGYDFETPFYVGLFFILIFSLVLIVILSDPNAESIFLLKIFRFIILCFGIMSFIWFLILKIKKHSTKLRADLLSLEKDLISNDRVPASDFESFFKLLLDYLSDKKAFLKSQITCLRHDYPDDDRIVKLNEKINENILLVRQMSEILKLKKEIQRILSTKSHN